MSYRKILDGLYRINKKRYGKGTVYDTYKFEGECPICGKGRTLYPLPMTIRICPRCYKRFHYPDRLNAVFKQSLFGVTCMLCGRKTWVYYEIRNPHICIPCIDKIGGGTGKIKVAGSKVYW